MLSKKHVATVSFGKDSLAMLYVILENNLPLDEVIFFDTGAEFQAIYNERDRVLPILEKRGIKYTEVRPKDPFFYNMFARPVRSRKTGKIHKLGYSWCGGSCRWGTRMKHDAMKKLTKDCVVYVGIAADESERAERQYNQDKEFPLIDRGMTESDCLQYCYSKGHTWEEDGVRLYDVLDRVSCWCCRNKNQKELIKIHDMLPKYWERLVALEELLGPMKSRPLAEIVSKH